MAERGSTLPEVLVALAVLGLGVAASAQLLLQGLSTESQAALREVATQRLADAAELAAAWAGAPPARRVLDWQASAAALRPDDPGSVAAALDPMSAPGTSPVQLRASLRWGDAIGDTASLISTSYVTNALPP